MSNVMAQLRSLYDFLVQFESNIWPNAVRLRAAMLHNINDLEIDLSGSLKVKSYGTFGVPICDMYV